MTQGVFAKNLELLLSSFRDKTLTSVRATFYERNGIKADLPLYIRFVFSDCATGFRVGCASDGESLTFDQEELVSYSMQDDGNVSISDISNIQFIQKCIGNKIEKIYFVTLESGLVIGFEIYFVSASSICLLNRGDDLVLSDHFPIYLATERVNKVQIFP